MPSVVQKQKAKCLCCNKMRCLLYAGKISKNYLCVGLTTSTAFRFSWLILSQIKLIEIPENPIETTAKTAPKEEPSSPSPGQGLQGMDVTEPPGFQFMTIASCPVTEHHWQESGIIFLSPTL